MTNIVHIFKLWYNSHKNNNVKHHNTDISMLLLIGIFGGYTATQINSKVLSLFKLSTIQFIFFLMILYIKYEKINEYKIYFAMFDTFIIILIIKLIVILSNTSIVTNICDKLLILP